MFYVKLQMFTQAGVEMDFTLLPPRQENIIPLNRSSASFFINTIPRLKYQTNNATLGRPFNVLCHFTAELLTKNVDIVDSHTDVQTFTVKASGPRQQHTTTNQNKLYSVFTVPAYNGVGDLVNKKRHSETLCEPEKRPRSNVATVPKEDLHQELQDARIQLNQLQQQLEEARNLVQQLLQFSSNSKHVSETPSLSRDQQCSFDSINNNNFEYYPATTTTTTTTTTTSITDANECSFTFDIVGDQQSDTIGNSFSVGNSQEYNNFYGTPDLELSITT